MSMFSDTLKPGQVLRRGGELWRVLYVNECRARILPFDRDDRQETNERYGKDIAPTSLVEIVTDLERARMEIELAQAEKELAAAKQEVAEQTRLQRELVEAEAELAAMRRELAATPAPVAAAPSGRGRGATWSLADGDHIIGAHPAGSVKAEVIAYLKAHPNATTQAVQGASKGTPGAVAACLDRFWKSGVVVKKS